VKPTVAVAQQRRQVVIRGIAQNNEGAAQADRAPLRGDHTVDAAASLCRGRSWRRHQCEHSEENDKGSLSYQCVSPCHECLPRGNLIVARRRASCPECFSQVVMFARSRLATGHT
jgi:hypothetical protein